VNRQAAIRRLLAILVIVGLALAPLSRPVIAATVFDVSMSATADDNSMTMDDMANDMACCPSKALGLIGCDKCVFMAACMSICFAGISTAVSHPLLAASDSNAPLQDDSGSDSLDRLPPEHPPRILV
jgi:hypothetical protein